MAAAQSGQTMVLLAFYGFWSFAAHAYGFEFIYFTVLICGYEWTFEKKNVPMSIMFHR